MTTARTSLVFWPGDSPELVAGVRRTLYGYVCERMEALIVLIRSTTP